MNNYNIEGYFNNIPSYRMNTENNKKEYNYIGRLFSGIKWECIEFIRRYFIINYFITFIQVENVYDMLNLNYFFDFLNLKEIPLKFICKCNYIPKVEDLVLFKHGNTGHIAIISSLTDNPYIVKICEQNWINSWESYDYSRSIFIKDSNIIGFFRLYNK
jgi:hypothetical protein